MSEMLKEKLEPEEDGRSRSNPSLFGPILLIAVGGYFLLQNMGLLEHPAFYWELLWRLWPLALIFAGVNVLARQFPRPFGSLLSAVVSLAAVALFGGVLLFGPQMPLVNQLQGAEPADLKVDRVEFAGDGVTAADVEINFGLASASLFALEDSGKIIDGSISYLGQLSFDARQNGDKAIINLETRDGDVWFFINPSNWFNFEQADQWQIGLNPNVKTDLRLNGGLGSLTLDLAAMDLSYLEVDGGAGSITAALPGGDYDGVIDIGAGSLKITLPADGRHTFDIDGGAGSMTFYLPPNMAARLELDSGVGGFNLEDGRFRQVSGRDEDEGVWITPGYEDAANRVNLRIDIGAGSVRIEPAQGR